MCQRRLNIPNFTAAEKPSLKQVEVLRENATTPAFFLSLSR